MNSPNSAVDVFKTITDGVQRVYARPNGRLGDTDRWFPGNIILAMEDDPRVPAALGEFVLSALQVSATLRIEGQPTEVAQAAQDALIEALQAHSMRDVVQHTAFVNVAEWPGIGYDIHASRAYDDGTTAGYELMDPNEGGSSFQTLPSPDAEALGNGVLQGLDQSTTLG